MELALHLGSFRSFDMIAIGAYMISIQSYYKEARSGKIRHGMPTQKMLGTNKAHFFDLRLPDVNSVQKCFTSSSFYIDYNNHPSLNEICAFRYCFSESLPEQITVKFKLLSLKQPQVSHG